ncbi:MAG TPA: hypothetical protein PKK74_01980 [Candidatus Methanoculleus thermohydrogenotrophicum]|jgi:hypothetical protein|nr:hypothetical protein [Candidatus Methanoculleus thermohydrogenotrophicum]NLM82996.1 hypothetical protein [Candidatus Methanoculleus thermohydrogenotrophicum]HOB17454.1 hypothetical protein [Candidatus Methanoculleus thermohydrogenotrophicum]HPZ37558.1 hypothetical protein [Candidatus Methanoculleus thermohydrogenotrophicum]HQC90701.1 hypothetical protein [Candidatus Methanoculleus thermohydrogenotrophicum]
MRPEGAAPHGAKESGQVFTVVARLGIDETLSTTSGPEILRIVPGEGSGPAAIRAAWTTPGGDRV